MIKIEKPKLNVELLKDVSFEKSLDEQYVNGYEFNGDMISMMEIEYLHFDGCVFKNVIFEECIFENIDMLDCIFDGCDLSNIQMINGCIHRCEFHNCRLVGSDFSSNTIHNTIFDHNNARYMNLSFVKFKNVAIIENDMMSSSFNETIFKTTTFTNNNLTLTEFMNADCSSIDLSTSTIDGIVLTEKSMKGLSVSSLQAIDLSKLLGLKISDES